MAEWKNQITQVAFMFCFRCKTALSLALRPDTPSFKDYLPGVSDAPCPSCRRALVFWRVAVVPHPYEVVAAIMNATTNNNAERVAQMLLSSGAHQVPMEPKADRAMRVKDAIKNPGALGLRGGGITAGAADLVTSSHETPTGVVKAVEAKLWEDIGIDFDGNTWGV